MVCPLGIFSEAVKRTQHLTAFIEERNEDGEPNLFMLWFSKCDPRAKSPAGPEAARNARAEDPATFALTSPTDDFVAISMHLMTARKECWNCGSRQSFQKISLVCDGLCLNEI